jgi:hypothetical protein
MQKVVWYPFGQSPLHILVELDKTRIDNNKRMQYDHVTTKVCECQQHWGVFGMPLANKDIRETAKGAGVKLWQIAIRYGCTDGNFSRKLRQELPEGEKVKILNIISKLQVGE